jgi:hypothetical protein
LSAKAELETIYGLALPGKKKILKQITFIQSMWLSPVKGKTKGVLRKEKYNLVKDFSSNLKWLKFLQRLKPYLLLILILRTLLIE